MNGSRLAKCMFCRILHSVSLNKRIHSIHRLRLAQASIHKNHGVSFTTYQKLLKQSDGVESGSSSSESDSSDSDSDSEQLNTVQTKTDGLLSMLQKTEHVMSKDKDSAKKAEVVSSDMTELFEYLKEREKKTSAKTGNKSYGHKEITEMFKDSINPELVSEAQNLSKVLPGNSQENESKLLGQLLQQFKTTANQKSGGGLETKGVAKTSPQSMRSVMEGLTVRRQSKDSFEAGFHLDDVEKRTPTFRSAGVGLFSGQPLGIFSKKYMETAKKDKESLFEVLAEEERSLAKFYPPENAFEEHIQWTREGRMWTFPIDNEAGWEEEKNTSFEDHVFLENKLVGFPKKGPIRHFMELVCVSLSKNPYLSAAQKFEHLEWYRNYFFEKQVMLEERLGADGVVKSRESLNE